MKTEEDLVAAAYIALVSLPHSVVRLKLQPTMAALRDALAEIRGEDPEEIQNAVEMFIKPGVDVDLLAQAMKSVGAA